jgi:hypothetical protein
MQTTCPSIILHIPCHARCLRGIHGLTWPASAASSRLHRLLPHGSSLLSSRRRGGWERLPYQQRLHLEQRSVQSGRIKRAEAGIGAGNGRCHLGRFGDEQRLGFQHTRSVQWECVQSRCVERTQDGVRPLSRRHVLNHGICRSFRPVQESGSAAAVAATGDRQRGSKRKDFQVIHLSSSPLLDVMPDPQVRSARK